MKNVNKLNLSFALTVVFALLFLTGESWCQKKHSSDSSVNKKANLAFAQFLSENLGEIHAAPLVSQSPAKFYLDNKIVKHMKEVQIRKGDVKGKSDDTTKAKRYANSTFRQYYGVGLPHIIDPQQTFGGFMSFDDGSFWAIDPRDIISAMYWDPMTIIFVQQSNDPFSTGYNYVLINNNNDEAVRAMYIGGR